MSAKTPKIHADLEEYLDRLITAFERAVESKTSSKPDEDWHARFLALQEQYRALSSLYQSTINTPPVIEKNNQLRLALPPDPQETANTGLVQIDDLLNTVSKIGTANIFEVLRYYFAQIEGDVLKMVEIRAELFNSPSSKPFSSSLTLSDNLSHLDLIRIIRSFVDCGFFIDRSTGKPPTYKALYDVAEQVLNIDLSEAPTKFSNTIKDAISEETQTSVFGTMAQTFLNKSVRKKLK